MLICLNENFWFLNLNYCHILSVSRTIEWYMYELKRQKSFGPPLPFSNTCHTCQRSEIRTTTIINLKIPRIINIYYYS